MQTRRRHLKVFLCHASGDKPQVRELYKRLIADGADAWLDEERLLPGQDWRDEISKAVREADIVIICLSNTSVTKEGTVQREMKFALDVAEEKPEGLIFIIPARLEECVVPERLRRWHWVDLFNDNGYQKLIMALNSRAMKIEVLPLKIRDKTHPRKNETLQPEKSIVEKKFLEFDSQERVLEAVIEKRINFGEPTSLFVWIKRMGSKSILSVISSIDENILLDEDNVKSKGLEIEFPIENGRVLATDISLKLIAYEFSPAVQQKKINIPPEGDSEVCKFILTPAKTGTLLLSLEVLKDEVSLTTLTLRTTAIETGKKENSPLALMSIPIIVFAQTPKPIIQKTVKTTKPRNESEKNLPPNDKLQKTKINLSLLGWIALATSAVIFISIFITAVQTLIARPVEPTIAPISLLDAKVEFKITTPGDTQTFPAYGILTLHHDDQISIETNVTDANGVPYPHDLEITYFIASGGIFYGNIAPYIAKQLNDIITVLIKDQITSEIITRPLLININ